MRQSVRYPSNIDPRNSSDNLAFASGLEPVDGAGILMLQCVSSSGYDSRYILSLSLTRSPSNPSSWPSTKRTVML